MAVNYQILSSSPPANGFHPNGIIGGDTAWKSLSNPAFVILALDSPMAIHHVSLVNAGAAIVEIMGLPSSSPTQGVNAKENLYRIILDGTTLANPADWKSQTNVDESFEFLDFDDDAAGVLFSQLKITLRGYGSGKAIGMKHLRINAKAPIVKPASVTLPSLALELESDDEEVDALPSLKSNASSLLQDRLADLKEKMQKEEEKAQKMDVDAPPVSLVPSVSYVVKVANEAEFDPEYETKKMVVEEPAKPVVRKEKSKMTTAAAPMPPSDKPLSHIVLTVSGIGPERAEVRKTLTDLGGTYSQNLPSNPAPGQLLILLVEASSDQWVNTPKHQQAVAQNVSIVDRSWLTACEKKKQFLAVAPYLAQFRTGAGKAKQAPPANTLAPPSPAKGKKSTIKSEGGSFATDKPAKGDEVESDGPDEYVFDDFVVPDEADIEYFDDPLDYIDEDNFGAFSAHNKHGHNQHVNTKKTSPKVSQHNIPAKRIWNADDVQNRWECWLAKCSAMLPGKSISINQPPNLNAIPKSISKPHSDTTNFGMDVDDTASDGTNPIEAGELADLNNKDWM